MQIINPFEIIADDDCVIRFKARLNEDKRKDFSYCKDKQAQENDRLERLMRQRNKKDK